MRAAGMTLRAIADELERLEMPRIRGGKWTAKAVERVILAYERRTARD